ncbi:MAG: trypsin-like peptidase domain-containing protein, partial [Rhodospirillales bacterium]|nr:trypsin-like peptidase domain-containing protein [Rhodospirillales bacterium]
MFPAEQFGRAYLVMPQSTMNLENVLGRNANFERLVNYNATDQLRILANPVGRLDLLMRSSNGMGVATCTASIISNRYILTNNHCTPGDHKSAKVEAAHLLMDFYDEGREEQVRKFDVVLPPVEHDRKLDYAIFEVKGDPSAVFGRVKLLPRDPEPGESLLIIHHPAGLPKHATRGGCRAAAPRAVRDTDILHRCDTLPGSSGSPILASNAGAVIGIHYAGSSFAGPGSYNFGKRLKAIAGHSPIITAILRDDAEIASRGSRERAAREARARAEREA